MKIFCERLMDTKVEIRTLNSRIFIGLGFSVIGENLMCRLNLKQVKSLHKYLGDWISKEEKLQIGVNQ